MESVLEKIRKAREDEKKKKADVFPAETIIDGCKVKIRYDAESRRPVHKHDHTKHY